MNLDTGLAVVILAILIFYLRLIALQRERARRVNALLAAPARKAGKGKQAAPRNVPRYTILSRRRGDWFIAGLGVLAILAGMLLNAGVFFPAVQPYWWVPTALGILAFSWAFQLQAGDERP